jgi:mono/diheme cytochrome c family protein
VAGRWQVEVAVSRPNAFDARTAFRFDVGIGSAGGGAAFLPSRATGNLAWAWEVILLGGLVLAVTNTWWSRDRAARGVNVLAAATVVVGIVMWFGLPHTHGGAPASTGGPVNPFTPDAASIAAGGATFQSLCSTCHGARGLGDGPQAGGLIPPPANLGTHVPLHSDGELFIMVADGFPRTAMTGFRGQLTDEQIWHVVNFLRTLEDPNGASAPAGGGANAPPTATVAPTPAATR